MLAATTNNRLVPQWAQAGLAVPALDLADGLSYEAYLGQINRLAEQMRVRWRREDKVGALKVVIQLAKLLADTRQAKLYQKKHSRVVETLDEFGRLIHERVRSIAARRARPRGDNEDSTTTTPQGAGEEQDGEELEFEPQEQAREIYRNWLLKIMSIRELVPRFYTELAILRTSEVLFATPVGGHPPGGTISHGTPNTTRGGEQTPGDEHVQRTLVRLTNQCTGLGDPIVALHAHAYLCRVAERLVSWRAGASETNLFDLLSLNLKSCARLICRLDVQQIAQQQQQQTAQQALPNRQAEGQTLHFDLLSNAFRSILNIVANRFNLHEDDDEPFVARARAHLIGTLEDILATLQSELEGQNAATASSFSRNVILNALFMSLPNKLACEQARRLLGELKVSYDRWALSQPPPVPGEGQTITTTTTTTKTTGMTTKASDEQKGDEEPDERPDEGPIRSGPQNLPPEQALVMPTIYASLSNFLIALDGSDALGGGPESPNRTSEAIKGRPNDDDHAGGQRRGDDEHQEKARLEIDVLTLAEVIVSRLLERQNRRITSNHLRCYKALLTFTSHHALNRLDGLLTSLVVSLKHERQYVAHSPQIMDLIKTLFTQQSKMEDFKTIVALKPFNQLMFDFLRKDEHRLDVARHILETLRSHIRLSKSTSSRRDPEDRLVISDRLMINFLLKLFATLNNSLSPLAAEDDLRHLSELVVFFIELVRYDDHLELLEFYSRCRSSLANLNQVLEVIIGQVLELPETHRRMENRPRPRKGLLNCCLAFAFTTLLAIPDQETRVRYYLQGCRQALEHKSLSLADYFMRQIIVNLLEAVESQHRELDLEGHPRGTEIMGEPLTSQVTEVLNLMLKFQDRVNSKHKQTLSQLVRSSFGGGCPNLLQSLKHLSCDLVVDDDFETASFAFAPIASAEADASEAAADDDDAAGDESTMNDVGGVS